MDHATFAGFQSDASADCVASLVGEPMGLGFLRVRAKTLGVFVSHEHGLSQERVILDSDGVLETAMEEDMGNFQKIEDVAVRNAVRAQEERRHRDIKKRLDVDDLLFPTYLRFVDKFLEGYSDRTSRGEKALRNYVRLVLSLPLIQITSMYDLRDGNSHLRQYHEDLQNAAAAIKQHESVEPSIGGYGEIAWALCGAGEKRRFMRVGLDPQRGKEIGVTFYVPADTFNEDDQLILQIGESAEAMITQWTWLDYGLPQIAIQARNYMMRYGWSLEDTQSAMGWEISDYRKVGLP
ncbi:MAG: hypothetical protein QME81_18305 [bacterium]|nr:hypothetical protein [bacterium]